MERSADWLDEAIGDLEHAKNDIKSGFYNWACFSAQQSAEKAVKAIFEKIGGEAWGYSVADLLEALAKERNVPEELIDMGLELDKAYIPTRYPNALPSGSPRRKYNKREAERLTSYAEEIVKFCKNILSTI
jgi:HEPN domain-containing protein